MADFLQPDPAPRKFSEPHPVAFGTLIERYHEYDPKGKGLERSQSRINQTRGDTKTLIWGERDALPMMIMDAVNKSPTASSCIGKLEKFIRGSGFSDKGLENMVVDDHGTTLLQYHQYNSMYMALLDGFAANFKFNNEGTPQITNVFGTPIECLRFKKPEENTTEINTLVFNPYFGTGEYTQAQNKEYNVWDLSNVTAEQAQHKEEYCGQIYFQGRVRPPYKFYPVPRYWSAEKWIYVDANIQEFHKENLSNGFFMSALLNVIGDPNEMSQDPRYQKKVTGTDGIVRNEPTHTVGQVFDIEMAKTFSGTKKAGSVMVMWSVNQDQFVKVSNFPVNTNYDVMSGTFTDAIRGITIGTEVPAILANLPQQASSLGSDGNAMKAAVELMQANARDPQSILEQYYNNVLLPNHVNGSVTAKVKLLPYSPVTTTVTIDKQYWEFLNEAEKSQFLKDNVPSVKIIRPVVAPVDPLAPVDPNAPIDPPQPTQVDENLKGLKVSEINKITSIVRKFQKGQLTLDQAKQLLSGYGLSEEQQTAWLS